MNIVYKLSDNPRVIAIQKIYGKFYNQNEDLNIDPSSPTKEIIKSFALLRMTLKILDKDDEDENSGSSSAPVVPPSNKEE